MVAGAMAVRGGTVTVEALASTAGPGRGIGRKIVTLELAVETDATVHAALGIGAVRQARILRLCTQAFEQGGLLTHEDLAGLLSASLSTVKRDLREVEAQGVHVPIGRRRGRRPTLRRLLYPAHAVALHLRGDETTEIERRLRLAPGHCWEILDRYRRVIALSEAGHAEAEIARLADLSPVLVRDFLTVHGRGAESTKEERW